MVEGVKRHVRHDESGWIVASTPKGKAIATHAALDTALEHSRRELLAEGGGLLHVRYADGTTTREVVSPPVERHVHTATRWYDGAVPWVILLAPVLLTSILGSAMPFLFAPAILDSDGTVIGVGIATFVFSAAVAVPVVLYRLDVVTDIFLLVGIGIVTVVVANLLAPLLGSASLDFWTLVPEWWPDRQYVVIRGVNFWDLVTYTPAILLAGVLTYGVGGLILGAGAGALAGWRFADWYENRANG